MEPPSVDNPYKPPLIEAEESVLKSLEIPKNVKNRVLGAFVAGLVSGTVTLILTLLSIFHIYNDFGFNAWSFIDVGLILGLTIGIFFKSRTCAIVMTAYFIYSKIYMMIEFQQYNGILISGAFLVLYVLGIVGTFQYHHLKQKFLAQRLGSN